MTLLPVPLRVPPRSAPFALWHSAAYTARTGEEADLSLPEAMEALRAARRTIEAQEERIRRLEAQSQTDELTGLASRGALLTALRRELALTRRDRKNAGFLILLEMQDDIEVAQDHGRAAANAFIQMAGSVLLSEVRSADLVAHLGQGLFAIVMPQIDVKNAAGRLARLEKALSTRTAHLRGLSLPYQVRLGFAFIEESETPESLLVAADAKLYACKARKG